MLLDKEIIRVGIENNIGLMVDRILRCRDSPNLISALEEYGKARRTAIKFGVDMQPYDNKVSQKMMEVSL